MADALRVDVVRQTLLKLRAKWRVAVKEGGPHALPSILCKLASMTRPMLEFLVDVYNDPYSKTATFHSTCSISVAQSVDASREATFRPIEPILAKLRNSWLSEIDAGGPRTLESVLLAIVSMNNMELVTLMHMYMALHSANVNDLVDCSTHLNSFLSLIDIGNAAAASPTVGLIFPLGRSDFAGPRKNSYLPTWQILEKILCSAPVASYLPLRKVARAQCTSRYMSWMFLASRSFLQLTSDGCEVESTMKVLDTFAVKRLTVCSTPTDDWLDTVSWHFTNLEEINFGAPGCRITDLGFRSLAESCHLLKVLQINNDGWKTITDDAVWFLSTNCFALTRVTMLGCDFTEHALDVFAGNCHFLRELHLDVSLTDEGLKALQSFYGKCLRSAEITYTYTEHVNGDKDSFASEFSDDSDDGTDDTYLHIDLDRQFVSICLLPDKVSDAVVRSLKSSIEKVPIVTAQSFASPTSLPSSSSSAPLSSWSNPYTAPFLPIAPTTFYSPLPPYAQQWPLPWPPWR